MSGLWSQGGFPHTNWKFVSITDMKTDDDDDYERGTCEACGNTELRYVHTLRHDEYERQIETGCECASKLEADSNAALGRERSLINLAKRRANWLNREWRVSAKGNDFLTHKGYKLGVSQSGSRWKYWLLNTSNNHLFGKSGFYATEDEAKLALFNESAAFFGW